MPRRLAEGQKLIVEAYAALLQRGHNTINTGRLQAVLVKKGIVVTTNSIGVQLERIRQRGLELNDSRSTPHQAEMDARVAEARRNPRVITARRRMGRE